MLAGDGELQGKPLEKILCLCRRDPGTVPELSGEAGEREGEVPQPSPSSLGPRALRAQKWRQGIGRTGQAGVDGLALRGEE